MGIRMRRGNSADFDATKMQSGEFAVCLDNGYVYMTLSAGNVIRLGTADAIAEEVENSEAYALGTRNGSPVGSTDPTYHNNSKYYSEQAGVHISDAEAYAIGKRNGADVPSSDPTYHNNSKYYSEQSNTLGQTQVQNAEAYALGTRGGSAVPSSDPTYHNNSKYYSEQANTYKTGAQTAANSAEDSAEDSEAWAVGKRNGVDVPSTDPAYNNNAKHWADAAAAVVGIGIATTTTAGIVKPDGTTITVDPDGTIHHRAASIVGEKLILY